MPASSYRVARYQIAHSQTVTACPPAEPDWTPLPILATADNDCQRACEFLSISRGNASSSGGSRFPDTPVQDFDARDGKMA
jgi:hypothetical protein